MYSLEAVLPCFRGSSIATAEAFLLFKPASLRLTYTTPPAEFFYVTPSGDVPYLHSWEKDTMAFAKWGKEVFVLLVVDGFSAFLCPASPQAAVVQVSFQTICNGQHL